jgi:hypothetical protein
VGEQLPGVTAVVQCKTKPLRVHASACAADAAAWSVEADLLRAHEPFGQDDEICRTARPIWGGSSMLARAGLRPRSGRPHGSQRPSRTYRRGAPAPNQRRRVVGMRRLPQGRLASLARSLRRPRRTGSSVAGSAPPMSRSYAGRPLGQLAKPSQARHQHVRASGHDRSPLVKRPGCSVRRPRSRRPGSPKVDAPKAFACGSHLLGKRPNVLVLRIAFRCFVVRIDAPTPFRHARKPQSGYSRPGSLNRPRHCLSSGRRTFFNENTPSSRRKALGRPTH